MGSVMRRGGFTIVELLIVVVVIAILASITVTAYSGIQQRATSSAILSSVDAWEKALRVNTINGGQAPPVGSCLGVGADFTATADFPVNVCVMMNGNPEVSYSNTGFSGWNAQSPRPNGALPMVAYNFDGSALKARGIWVHSLSTDGRDIAIAWLSRVNGSCGRGIVVPSGAAIGSLNGGYCILSFSLR